MFSQSYPRSLSRLFGSFNRGSSDHSLGCVPDLSPHLSLAEHSELLTGASRLNQFQHLHVCSSALNTEISETPSLLSDRLTSRKPSGGNMSDTDSLILPGQGPGVE